MRDFQNKFYGNLPVKKMKDKPITSEMYLNLARGYVEAMNHGKIPVILDVFEGTLQG